MKTAMLALGRGVGAGALPWRLAQKARPWREQYWRSWLAGGGCTQSLSGRGGATYGVGRACERRQMASTRSTTGRHHSVPQDRLGGRGHPLPVRGRCRAGDTRDHTATKHLSLLGSGCAGAGDSKTMNTRCSGQFPGCRPSVPHVGGGGWLSIYDRSTS